ncbi:MAG: ABC transporter permease [Burkholderiales bacterium]|nr:ABC transporter permease [Burkholderiales bacterium]
MKTASLALLYLWSRPLAAVLNLLLLALGVSAITFVVLVSEQVDRAFERDLAGIDAVVGAKGSPLQLIMAGVFHIDVPPGNVALEDVRRLSGHPMVKHVIPLALGDTFRGWRIAGTTPQYVEHYRVQPAQGRLWREPMEAVLGAEVARNSGLANGMQFSGSHGLAPGGEQHSDVPYRVVGVLAPCQCVLDRLVLTGIESVWRVHEKALAVDEEDRKALEAEREVTMALVTYKTPLAAVTFPRFVNSQTNMQAAAPAVEVTRLLRMLGTGTDVLRGFGAVLLLVAALSVFIALWNAVRERSADLAMMRMLGAPPWKVAALLFCEALWLALLASAIGLAAGHGLAALVGYVLQSRQSVPVTGWTWAAAEAWIPVAAVAAAGLAALVPAIAAYRVDVARLLNSR